MVATAAIGETAALMSKGPKLPGFGQASRMVEANTGLRLMDAAAGAERVILSVNEGTIRIVLPVNAVLEEAAKGEGLIPFEASQALKHWNAGTWSLDVD